MSGETKDEAKAARGKITAVSGILQELKTENKQLIDENDGLIAENEELRNELNRIKKSGSSASADAAEKLRQMELAHTRFLTDLGREHGEKLNQINANHAAEMAACRKEIEPVKADLSAAVQEIESLKRMLQQERDTNAANMASLGNQQAQLNANAQAAFDQQLNQLKQQLADSQSVSENSVERAERFMRQNECEELRRQLAAAQKAGADGDAAAAAAAAAAKAMEDEIARLKQQVSSQQTQIADLRSKLAAAQAASGDAAAAQKKLEDEIACLKEDFEKLKKMCQEETDRLQKEVSSKETEIAELKRQLEAARKAGADGDAAAAAAAAAQKKLEDEIAQLKKQVSSQETEIAELKRQLEAARKAGADGDAAAAAAAAAQKKLEDEIAQLKQQLADAQKTLKDEKATFATLATNMEKEIEDLKAQLAKANADLKAQQDANLAAGDAAGAAAAEIAGLKDQLASAQAELADLKAKLDAALKENGDLKARLTDLESQLNALRGELNSQLAAEKQLSASNLASEKDRGAASLQSLQQQLGAQHAQAKKDWEAAMAELRRKLAELQSKYDATIAAFEKAKADALKADADAAAKRNAEEAAAHEAAMDAMKRRWQRQIQELEECHEKELAALKTVISAMPNASKHIRDAENLINSLKGTHRATAHMFQSMER